MPGRSWILSGVLLLSPSIAEAQQVGGQEFLELFGMLDGNNDMAIERSEVPEKGRAAFDRVLKVIDANGDGRLELTEYRDGLRKARESAGPGGFNRPGAGGGQGFAAMDRDGDGKLSKDEFRGPPALFDRLDTDSDGSLSREEAQKGREAAGLPINPPGAMFPRLGAMDKNGDKKVSRDEFDGPAALFDRLDTNKDGMIGPDDLRGMRPDGLPALRKAQRPRPEPAKPADEAPKGEEPAKAGEAGTPK